MDDPKAYWDSKFARDDYYYGEAPNDWLKECITSVSLPSTATGLSLGEGEGRNAVFVAKQQGIHVTAVDASPIGLKKAEELAERAKVSANLNFVCADLTRYDLPTSQFDLIYSIFCHMDPPHRKHLHLNCVKALKPGGYFVLEMYHPRQLEFKTGGPQNVNLLVTAKEIESELPGMKIITARDVEREVIEGKGHFGKAAVVQVFAQKPSS